MQVSAYLKLSVAVAVATIALKTGAWWLTDSVSLLSDALESLVNLAGAMFALAMFNFEGRAGARNTQEGARLLDGAARLGHAAAAYDLGLLYLQGQQFPQDFNRAAELFRQAADAVAALAPEIWASISCNRLLINSL